MERTGGDRAGRPPVAVVVPFHGTRDEAAECARALAGMRLRPDDEVLLVDNTPDGVAAGLDVPPVRVIAAPWQQSSYHARNVGTLASSAAWILFTDADCRPHADVLDRYFADPIPEGCAALVGDVVGAPDQTGLVPEFSRTRRLLDQSTTLRSEYAPFGQTANLLVRRAAWEAVGGFLEGIRSGGDTDFCWRLQDAGWRLEARPGAVVEHLHRESVRGLVRQKARYGAALGWLARRHPGARRRYQHPRHTARALLGVGALLLTGRPRRATLRMLDAVGHVTWGLSYRLRGNASPPGRPAGGRVHALDVAIVAFRFPELSQTFVVGEARALRDLGHRVQVLARHRPTRPEPSGAHGLRVTWLEDPGMAERVTALAWLVVRRPWAPVRDRRLVRRLAAEEPGLPPLRLLAPAARRLSRDGVRHLHAHFANLAAADAMRLAQALGITWSVTAHAFDIYQRPSNLRTKLRDAAFATSGCRYTVADLQRIIGDDRAGDVHEIIMGVDAGAWTRRRPYPGGRTALAVGRLVEKKGFGDLLAALALPDGAAVERLVLVGDGPLQEALEAQAAALGLGDRVTFAGPRRPPQIRKLLEEADVLVMPCVVAADGDRDSMPVVVKEAMAMEVPVLVTREVGLPELVTEDCGRLVAPGDPPALAAGLRELLELPVADRVALGRAGRDRVRRMCDIQAESAKLAALIGQATSRGRAS